MENVLTLGKLLSLWFCFLLHSILFLISQTSYRTYKTMTSSLYREPLHCKVHYRKLFLQDVLARIDECDTATDVAKGASPNYFGKK